MSIVNQILTILQPVKKAISENQVLSEEVLQALLAQLDAVVGTEHHASEMSGIYKPMIKLAQSASVGKNQQVCQAYLTALMTQVTFAAGVGSPLGQTPPENQILNPGSDKPEPPPIQLWEYDESVNESNERLVIAARNGNLLEAHDSLAAGAEVNAVGKWPDQGFVTAVALARNHGHSDVVNLLVQRGALPLPMEQEDLLVEGGAQAFTRIYTITLGKEPPKEGTFAKICMRVTLFDMYVPGGEKFNRELRRRVGVLEDRHVALVRGHDGRDYEIKISHEQERRILADWNELREGFSQHGKWMKEFQKKIDRRNEKQNEKHEQEMRQMEQEHQRRMREIDQESERRTRQIDEETRRIRYSHPFGCSCPQCRRF